MNANASGCWSVYGVYTAFHPCGSKDRLQPAMNLECRSVRIFSLNEQIYKIPTVEAMCIMYRTIKANDSAKTKGLKLGHNH